MFQCFGRWQLAAAALMAFTASVNAQPTGGWEMKAAMPAALNEVALAYVEGKVHVLGGSVLGFTGPYHEEYDPATDTWRARSPLPRALDHIGAAVLNGKIYAIGGFVGGGVHKDGQNTAFEYDPSLDTWRILSPLKAGRGSVAVVALDGRTSMPSADALPTGRQSQPTKRMIPRPTPGRSWRRCPRRATTRPRP
jgi:Kelch motif